MVPTSRLLGCLVLAGFLSPGAARAQVASPEQRAGRAAIVSSDLEGLRQALADGFDPNRLDSSERPQWWQVLGFEFFEALPLLIEHGAELEAVDSVQATALHHLTDLEKPRAVDALLRVGMDPDVRGMLSAEDKTPLARTALHMAAFRGYLEVARVLVAHGANLNAVDVGNATPLHMARVKGHEDVAAFLEGLGATADPDEAAGNPLRRPGAVPDMGGGDPGASGARGPAPRDRECFSQLDLSVLTGEEGMEGDPDCEDEGGGAARPSGGRGEEGEGAGRRRPSPAPPPRPPRPVYEVTAAHVLGGPLSQLWSSFQARHPEWGLDMNGHITNLEGAATIRSAGRIDALPPEWAEELYRIGVEQGLVVENPEAPLLVAPLGGAGVVQAQEAARIRQEQDAAASGELLGTGDEATSRAEGRPGR